jgi:putative DNA primase/helicase
MDTNLADLDTPPDPDFTAAASADDPLPGEPWTELGYARRLIQVYGDRLRYVPAWRKWLVWDGNRWAVDDTGQAHRWCKVIARGLTTTAYAVTDSDKRRAMVQQARRGESSAGVAGARGVDAGQHRG